ncbi:hypothetical protein VTL71DRAFT_2956 [Oculimacula yallundae]|uniref:Uncharacterized protein n=1 Tax=Oculimacula yallundae TaxID=86028 RepID=A0ABR4C5S2_9HELO
MPEKTMGRTTVSVLPLNQYRVVIKKGKRTYLTYLAISPVDTACVGMVKLNDLAMLHGLFRRSAFGISPLFKISLETAEILSLSPSSLESQNTLEEVIIESSTPNRGLTKSFHNPTLMSRVLFTSVGEQFLLSRSVDTTGSQMQAILVKRSMTVFGGLCAMIAALISSLLVGTLVGFLAHNAELGIMVAAGVGALVACMEAYLMHAFQ